jgi:hypothetical protein
LTFVRDYDLAQILPNRADLTFAQDYDLAQITPNRADLTFARDYDLAAISGAWERILACSLPPLDPAALPAFLGPF